MHAGGNSPRFRQRRTACTDTPRCSAAPCTSNHAVSMASPMGHRVVADEGGSPSRANDHAAPKPLVVHLVRDN